ncbi:MAG: radical SAM protein [Candidatus Aminicenantes bacterium]|nr:radical SAM protein [Candidatus Aminicenantes bacterium]
MKKNPFVTSVSLPEYFLWEKMEKAHNLISFDWDMTARCNFNCRHCYINLPMGDKEAKARELSPDIFSRIADKAVSLGALWCLLSGGEPLLRKDFSEIYMSLKKKGLLISIFTNASLITHDHIELFKKFPPRDIEVTVYGVTEDTFERVTRTQGAFKSFLKGVDLLLEGDINVRFKAMALRSNLHEIPEIARFCRERTKDKFRFDPFLHLRYDGNSFRNREIRSERLTAEDIVELEEADPERFSELKKECRGVLSESRNQSETSELFFCGAGMRSFSLSYDGIFRLCSSLWHPECLFDLKQGNLSEAWNKVVASVRMMRSGRKEFLQRCASCSLFNLCMWCPAHAYLESGKMDLPIEYFCDIAHKRVESGSKKLAKKKP